MFIDMALLIESQGLSLMMTSRFHLMLALQVK